MSFNLKEFLEKNNLVALTGFVAVVIGSFIAVDSRWAHASEITELRKDIAIQRVETEISSLKQRRQYLEDKIFELSIKKNDNKITSVEKAQLDRFKDQMKETVKDERKIKEKLK